MTERGELCRILYMEDMTMEKVYDKCCGIDVHKKLIVACLLCGRKSEVREFGTTTDKLLKSAFGKAVAWDYTDRNPTIGVTLPEYRSQQREVWSDDEAVQSLNACEEPILRICLYLAIGRSLRLGEILGLQWANVSIDKA